jgi:hypothetical protein
VPVANAAGLLETLTPEADAAKRWLTTRAAVKAALLLADTTKDALIDVLIPRVSALIARDCFLARDNAGGVAAFAQETLRATWFPTAAPRGTELALPWRVPVTEIVSVTRDGNALDPAEYRLVSAIPGRLQFLIDGKPACWSGLQLVVTFKAGFGLPGASPPDLEAACIEQVKAMLMAATRDPAIRSVNAPDIGAESYSLPGGDTFKGMLMPQVVDAIGAWRNPLP